MRLSSLTDPADAGWMGDTHATPVCTHCKKSDSTVRERGKPWGARCDICWEGDQNRLDNWQAISEGATAPPPPAPPRCSECTLLQDRYETSYRRWVLLEPRLLLPAESVPPWKRWFVQPDGTAVNSQDRPVQPGAKCRIAHRVVCPCGPTPAGEGVLFTVVREENRRRADRETPPGQLPGTA